MIISTELIPLPQYSFPYFRELKPGNILLGEQGHATLTYFCQINQVNDYLDFEAMHNLYVAPGKFSLVDITQSQVMRKPVFRVCDQVRLKPACSAVETS